MGHKVLFTGSVCRCGEVGVGLKPDDYINGRYPVKCKSGRAQSVTHDIAQLKHWMARALSSYSPERWMSHSFWCPGTVLIQVSRLVLGIPDTSRGTPVTPYYFSLDIALGITSYWIVKGVQNSSPCSCSTRLEREEERL